MLQKTGLVVVLFALLCCFYKVIGAFIAECYFHNATIDSVAERFGINNGTLIGMAHRYADALEPLYRQIIFEMRKSLFLHADETGWSMDGKKAYAWLFANDLFQVFAFR